MKERIFRGLLPVLIFTLNVTYSFAQTKNIFVSAEGSDSNSGLSLSQPLKSINAAIDLASAEDTIYILRGTYKEIIRFHNKNGLPDKSICLCGYSNKAESYPVIDGGLSKPSADAENDWMHINNSSWISVSRLKFVNGWTFPIKVKNSSYLTFEKCFFFGGKRVINAGGLRTHHILVENCFWDQGGNFLWTVEKDSAGVDAWLSMHHMSMSYFNGSLIDFSGTGGSIVIRGNKIIDAFQAVRFRGVKGCDSNIEIYDNYVSNMRDNDFEPEYYTYNLHIYHNFSHNVHRTLSIDNVKGGEIFYYGNVITTDNDEWTKKICVSFWKVYGKERQRNFPVYAFNNSFYCVGNAFKTEQELRDFKHYNNAYFFSDDKGWILNSWYPSDDFDYDCTNKPWPVNIIRNKLEMHGKICDVKYVDPDKRDLRLQAGSPAIDAGKIMSFKEFDWTQSYEGKAPDVGAYENDKLVEGPPFRFMTLTDSKIEYKEKPRIVRYYLDRNKLTIYFSDQINKLSVMKEDINVFSENEKVPVISVSFPRNNYEMIIETNAKLSGESISISFNKMPKGINGENATYWASTINIHKSDLE